METLLFLIISLIASILVLVASVFTFVSASQLRGALDKSPCAACTVDNCMLKTNDVDSLVSNARNTLIFSSITFAAVLMGMMLIMRYHANPSQAITRFRLTIGIFGVFVLTTLIFNFQSLTKLNDIQGKIEPEGGTQACKNCIENTCDVSHSTLNSGRMAAQIVVIGCSIILGFIVLGFFIVKSSTGEFKVPIGKKSEGGRGWFGGKKDEVKKSEREKLEEGIQEAKKEAEMMKLRREHREAREAAGLPVEEKKEEGTELKRLLASRAVEQAEGEVAKRARQEGLKTPQIKEIAYRAGVRAKQIAQEGKDKDAQVKAGKELGEQLIQRYKIQAEQWEKWEVPKAKQVAPHEWKEWEKEQEKDEERAIEAQLRHARAEHYERYGGAPIGRAHLPPSAPQTTKWWRERDRPPLGKRRTPTTVRQS